MKFGEVFSERLLQASRGDRVDDLKAASVLKKAKKGKRLQDWEEESLHGQCLRKTKEVRSEQSWVWLQNGDLKRETESDSCSTESEYKNKLS